jgi:hypothetical protein
MTAIAVRRKILLWMENGLWIWKYPPIFYSPIFDEAYRKSKMIRQHFLNLIIITAVAAVLGGDDGIRCPSYCIKRKLI